MKRSMLLVLILLTGCLWGSMASADDLAKVTENGAIRMAMSGQYPPFNFVDENNKLTGFDVEMGSEVAKRIGVEAQAVKHRLGWYHSRIIGQQV